MGLEVDGAKIMNTEKEIIAPILASTSCRYRRPVQFPDTLRIGLCSEIVDVDNGDFHHHYIAFSDAQNTVVTECTADLVAFNYKEGRRSPIPPGWI